MPGRQGTRAHRRGARYHHPPHQPLADLRVGIATVRGRPYYRFATALRRLGLRFDSLLPRDIPGYDGDAVLTTRAEAPAVPARAPMLFEDACGLEPAVLAGRLLRCRLGPSLGAGGEVLAGVDPGSRIGLSVSYCGREIESSLHSSPSQVADRLSAIFEGLEAARRIVRIGDGNGRMSALIAEALGRRCGAGQLEIEFVDERRTSPRTKSCNQGGKRDRMSALRISRRRGQSAGLAPTSVPAPFS